MVKLVAPQTTRKPVNQSEQDRGSTIVTFQASKGETGLFRFESIRIAVSHIISGLQPDTLASDQSG